MRKLRNEELNRLSIDAFKRVDKIPLIVILDNIRSMNNIGSVFRTSDAFRVEKIILCGITACPPNPEIHKTALGATETVDWAYSKDTIEVVKELQEQGYYVYAVEQAENSVSLEGLQSNNAEKVAVVFGHEVKGVQQAVVDASDAVLEIPQFGTKHSLNISVCAGIVIWEFARGFLFE